MAERIPAEIFHNTPLTETPQVLTERPRRQVVIDVYNRVFDRLMARRTVLEGDLTSGRFNDLAAVSQRAVSGAATPSDQATINDYRTLLNARTAFSGRRNINAASTVLAINEQEAAGEPLITEQTTLRERYQVGDFYLLDAVDHPLRNTIRTDRFAVPARDVDENFAIIDGAPVEGMIKFVDGEIAQVLADTTLTVQDRQHRASNLRFERDVLFTQSTPIFTEINEITHARNQLEAYYDYQDPLKSEWILSDWLNGENLLEDRRVLNIPQQERGRHRWLGCLPLLLLLPLPLLVSVTTSPCQGTGGDLRIEVFDPSKVSEVSLKGANERELGYLLSGLNQNKYRSSDDPALREALGRLQEADPAYLDEYLGVAERDEVQTGQRIRTDSKSVAWLNGTDFENQRMVLASCLSPEQRSQKAKENIDRRNHPRWYDGVSDLLGRIRQVLPKIEITLK